VPGIPAPRAQRRAGALSADEHQDPDNVHQHAATSPDSARAMSVVDSKLVR